MSGADDTALVPVGDLLGDVPALIEAAAADEGPQLPRVPGIYYDIPAEVYHQRTPDIANAGAINLIDEKTPRHWWHWINNPGDEEETAALTFGRAYHCALLEPDVFAESYCVLPEDAPARPTRIMLDAAAKGSKQTDGSKHRIEWWANWNAKNGEKECMSAAGFDLAAGMAKSLRGLPIELSPTVTIDVGELIDLCRKEVTIIYVDEETGLLCKARLDLLLEDPVIPWDLKSCMSAAPRDFMLTIFRRRYHVAAAHYTEALRAVGLLPTRFVYLATEKARPHVSGSYELPAPFEERGQELRRRGLAAIRHALDSQQYPHYTRRIVPLHPEGYMLQDDKEIYR